MSTSASTTQNPSPPHKRQLRPGMLRALRYILIFYVSSNLAFCFPFCSQLSSMMQRFGLSHYYFL